MSSTQSLKVTLTDPREWESWEHQFKGKAMGMHLWEHIDPDQNLPFFEKPPKPQIRDYERRPDAPQPPRRRNAPVSAAHLSDVGRAAYQLDLQTYVQDMKEFEKQDVAIQKLKDWVMDTVASHFQEVACSTDDSLAIWYRNLKEQVSVGEAQSEEDARDEYRMAIQRLRKPPRDWYNWLKTWEKAISLGKKKGIPEASKATTWAKDFLNAVDEVMGKWATAYRVSKADKINENQLTFRNLANDFRNEIMRFGKSQGSNKVAKGAFVSFAGQDADQSADGDAQQSSAEDEKAVTKESKKRRRSDDSVCAACGLRHQLPSCYYAFPEKAPRRFRPNKETRKEFEERLAADPSLKEQIQEIKAKRAKRQKPNSKDQKAMKKADEDD